MAVTKTRSRRTASLTNALSKPLRFAAYIVTAIYLMLKDGIAN